MVICVISRTRMKVKDKMVSPVSPQRRWRSPNGTELLRQRRLVGAGAPPNLRWSKIPAGAGTDAPLPQALGLRPPVHHSGVSLNSVPLGVCVRVRNNEPKDSQKRRENHWRDHLHRWRADSLLVPRDWS